MPNRSATFGFAISRRISTAWTSFLARVRARTSCARRASRRRMARVRSSGSPDPVERARGQEPCQRAGVEPVGLRPGLADAGVRRADDEHPATCGSMMRAISQALPVTSSATRSSRAEAPREQLERLGRRLDPAGRAQLAVFEIATSQKSRWTSSPMLSSHPPFVAVGRENRWANDIDGFALAAQPGKSQGRPPKSRARSPSRRNGLPSLRSPRRPLSRSAER